MVYIFAETLPNTKTLEKMLDFFRISHIFHFHKAQHEILPLGCTAAN